MSLSIRSYSIAVQHFGANIPFERFSFV